MTTTTIQVDKKVRERLNGLKLHPRETFNDIIERLLEDSKELNDETKKEIKQAIAAIEAGRYRTHDQVRKELGF